MRKWWWRRMWSVSLFLLLAAAGAQAAETAQVMQQEVKAVEQRWLDNEDSADVVETILADDFVHVLPMGFISKEDQVSYLRKHPNPPPASKHFEQLKVRIYGEVAIATGIVNAVAKGESTAKRTAFTDVFVRRGGKWLAVNAQESPLRAKAQ